MRERRDAGKSMEGIVLLAVGFTLSLGAGAVWGFWGYFAGPAAVLLLVAGPIASALIAEARRKKS
jgi:hypothetical protein